MVDAPVIGLGELLLVGGIATVVCVLPVVGLALIFVLSRKKSDGG